MQYTVSERSETGDTTQLVGMDGTVYKCDDLSLDVTAGDKVTDVVVREGSAYWPVTNVISVEKR